MLEWSESPGPSPYLSNAKNDEFARQENPIKAVQVCIQYLLGRFQIDKPPFCLRATSRNSGFLRTGS